MELTNYHQRLQYILQYKNTKLESYTSPPLDLLLKVEHNNHFSMQMNLKPSITVEKPRFQRRTVFAKNPRFWRRFRIP